MTRDDMRISMLETHIPELPGLHSPAITRSEEGHDLVLTANGGVIREIARELAYEIEHLDPEAYPVLTLDLRSATSLDPIVVHALFRARDQRSGAVNGGQGPEGDIRILVTSGRVQEFLDSLKLEPGFEIVHEMPTCSPSLEIPVMQGEDWRSVQIGSVDHWHELLAAARHHDAPKFRHLSGESHPICISAGAEPGGPAFGAWCNACPLHAEYGGCRALLDQASHAVELGNWDAAQLLVLALIAEAVGMGHDQSAGENPG